MEFIPPATQFCLLPSPFVMKRGGELLHARLAYETWGTLNSQRDNAILIITGLSPDAHAASHPQNPEAGWWEAMIGDGKAIDTQKWFVVCVNSLGSCKGSTGPASINPATNQPYRLDFPELTIEDAATAIAYLKPHLDIPQWECVIGNSMGGMTALALLAHSPECSRRHINISGSAQALPFSIAVRSLQREAIQQDPHWQFGHYTDESYPESGMSIARKLGVITYRSAFEWDGRFGRVRLDSGNISSDSPFPFEFQVESYLEAHAQRFIRRFDPNCYLYMSRAMDWFDLGEGYGGDVMQGLAAIRVQRALSLGANTDILFPPQQQQQIALGLQQGGCDAEFISLNCPQGHDAFLVDIAQFGTEIERFLSL